MRSWDVPAVDVKPHQPAILSSSGEARTVVVELPAGERLQDHEVHERAFVVVVTGALEVVSADGERVTGGPGLLVELDPQERHEVVAKEQCRFLLILTPWPGDGHPGTMTLDEKAQVRSRAAEQAAAGPS